MNCDGFQIDRDKTAEVAQVIYPDADTLSDEEEAEYDKAALLAMGLIMGAQIAIAAQDEEAYCANAEEEREDPSAEHLIWAAKE